jgi:hypothetical protein
VNRWAQYAYCGSSRGSRVSGQIERQVWRAAGIPARDVYGIRVAPSPS